MDIKVKPLSNPPIMEMALSASFEMAALEESDVERTITQLDPEFRRFATMQSGSFGYDARTDRAHSGEPRHWVGSRYRKGENVYVSLQNGGAGAVTFACSLLRPYESWDVFTQMAIPYLRKIRETLKPSKCLRFGVRTVDRLEAPNTADKIQLSSVIKHVSHGVTGIGETDVCEFYHRDTLLLPQYGGLYVTIIRTMQPQGPNKHPAIILDTDVYAYGEVAVDGEEFDALMKNIHIIRNKVFFDSIGDACLEGCR